MKKLIYDRKQLNSYKDFYEKIYEDNKRFKKIRQITE